MEIPRRLLLSTLSIIAFLSALTATLMVFAQDRILDAESFSTTAASMMQDPTINEYVADAVSDALIEQVPVLGLGGPLVAQVAGSVLESPAAAQVVESAALEAHQSMVTNGASRLVLDVSDLVVPIDRSLAAIRPELAGTIPSTVTTLAIDLDTSDLTATALSFVERVRLPTKVMVALIALLLLAIIVVESTMFRAATRIGIVLGSVGVVLLLTRWIGVIALSPFGRSDLEGDAIAAAWSIVVSDLVTWGWALTAVGASLAAIGWGGRYMTGPGSETGRARRIYRIPIHSLDGQT